MASIHSISKKVRQRVYLSPHPCTASTDTHGQSGCSSEQKKRVTFISIECISVMKQGYRQGEGQRQCTSGLASGCTILQSSHELHHSLLKPGSSSICRRKIVVPLERERDHATVRWPSSRFTYTFAITHDAIHHSCPGVDPKPKKPCRDSVFPILFSSPLFQQQMYV